VSIGVIGDRAPRLLECHRNRAGASVAPVDVVEGRT
jgi:hypothetical protein